MATSSQSTLLDLVQAVSEYTTSDEEVVASITFLSQQPFKVNHFSEGSAMHKNGVFVKFWLVLFFVFSASAFQSAHSNDDPVANHWNPLPLLAMVPCLTAMEKRFR